MLIDYYMELLCEISGVDIITDKRIGDKIDLDYWMSSSAPIKHMYSSRMFKTYTQIVYIRVVTEDTRLEDELKYGIEGIYNRINKEPVERYRLIKLPEHVLTIPITVYGYPLRFIEHNGILSFDTKRI